MKHINSNKEFNDLIKSGKPILMDFYADWCGPCRMLSPTIEKLASEYEGKAEIVKINVDEQRDIAAKFQVRSIPTLYFLMGNKVKDSVQGMTSEFDLKKRLDKLIVKAQEEE